MPLIDFNLLIRDNGRRYVANPATHLHTTTPRVTYSVFSSRPATPRDMAMTLSAVNTEILDMLSGGYNKVEFEAVAATLGYSEREIAEYQKREETGEISAEENTFRTILLACVVESIIEHKGTVDIIAILQATEAQLGDWEVWYLSEARGICAQMVEIQKTNTTGSFAESPRWATLRVQFERQAELLSQVQQRLGRFSYETA